MKYSLQDMESSMRLVRELDPTNRSLCEVVHSCRYIARCATILCRALTDLGLATNSDETNSDETNSMAVTNTATPSTASSQARQVSLSHPTSDQHDGHRAREEPLGPPRSSPRKRQRAISTVDASRPKSSKRVREKLEDKNVPALSRRRPRAAGR